MDFPLVTASVLTGTPWNLFQSLNGLALLAVLFIPFERIFLLRPSKILRKGFWEDIGLYFLNRWLETFLLALPFLGIAWLLGKFPLEGWHARVAAWPFWAKLLGGLIVGEMGSYWAHRFLHVSPFLWRFHKLHHAAEEMDWLVNIRVHPVEMVFMRMFQFIPLYALGFLAPASGETGVLLILIPLIGALWGYFIHSNVRLRFGPLEWLFTTPAFHHWHHTNDRPDLHNRNYSSLLPIFDLLFGSFHLPKGKRTRTYGIDEEIPDDFTGRLLSPFRKGPRRKKKAPAFHVENP